MYKVKDLTASQVWQGVILASVAHAIMVAFYPELAHEHSWDGQNYSVQDTQGGRGTITFQGDDFVGVFRCNMNYYIDDLESYFVDVPNHLKALAQNEALQYMLLEVDGKSVPIITTAFWSAENRVFTMDVLEQFQMNGGYLIMNSIDDTEAAIATWEEYYEMNDLQLKLLRILYEKRISRPSEKIIISKQEINMICASEEDALDECQTSFEEIGMFFEV